MNGPAAWELAFAVPGLSLPSSSRGHRGDGSAGVSSDGIALEDDRIVIAGASDARVQAICAANGAAAKLMGGFRTSGGHAHKPAALLIRADLPAPVRNDLEAVVSFRNAVAFSFILRARAVSSKNAMPAEPAWSDTFDL